MSNNKFKILSIDGGGIKGVFPAKILTSIEQEIGDGQIYKHFDLICGTSTGGIIALALSLGIPAKEVLNLYKDKAKDIFGSKNRNILSKPFYNNKTLEKLLREIFRKYQKNWLIFCLCHHYMPFLQEYYLKYLSMLLLYYQHLRLLPKGKFCLDVSSITYLL